MSAPSSILDRNLAEVDRLIRGFDGDDDGRIARLHEGIAGIPLGQEDDKFPRWDFFEDENFVGDAL